MTLEELIIAAKNDLAIDKDSITSYSLGLPKTIQKWTNLYALEFLKFEKRQTEYNILAAKKREHYLYNINEPVKEYGGGLQRCLDGDEELAPIKTALEHSRLQLEYIEKTLDNLKRVSFNIKNIIEWEKFQAGY